MANSVGFGWSTFFGDVAGMDPTFRLVTGTRRMAESLARRCTTRRNSLPGDPEFGTDVAERLSQRSTPLTLARLKLDLEQECRKDQRVLDVVVEIVKVDGKNHITIKGASSEGPFSLTLGVGQLGVELLNTTG